MKLGEKEFYKALRHVSMGYRSTFSSTQMLPDVSIIGRMIRSDVKAISNWIIFGMIICVALSKAVTRVGWSNGFPLAGSIRTFQTLKNPVRLET